MTATREQLIAAKQALEDREWFYYTELSEQAQEKALNRYVSDMDFDSEYVVDDMLTVCELLGVQVQRKDLRWSGFASQGDGASFVGEYRYEKGSAKATAQHAPQDVELNRIATRLFAIQRRNFYMLTASVRRTSSNYNHENTVSVEVHDARRYAEAKEETADEVTECLKDLMRWFYASLEAEYEYQTGDGAKEYLSNCDETEYDEEGNEWDPDTVGP